MVMVVFWLFGATVLKQQLNVKHCFFAKGFFFLSPMLRIVFAVLAQFWVSGFQMFGIHLDGYVCTLSLSKSMPAICFLIVFEAKAEGSNIVPTYFVNCYACSFSHWGFHISLATLGLLHSSHHRLATLAVHFIGLHLVFLAMKACIDTGAFEACTRVSHCGLATTLALEAFMFARHFGLEPFRLAF